MIRQMPSKSGLRRGSSLAEVARAAGVSIATASRVLNGENKELWAGTVARAERIRHAARTLGYRPDWRARSLRAARSNAIGVVYSEAHPMMDMTSYGPMFRAFGEIVQSAGFHVMFVHVPRTTGVQPASLLQAVDAAVFYHNVTEGEAEAAQLVRGPAILVNCEPKLPFPRVAPDDAAGATALVRHLLGLGHRRIAFADRSHPGAEWAHFSRTVRHNVMQQEMAEAGPANRLILWEADISGPRDEFVARYKNTPAADRPTAIVVSYSIEAVCLLNEFLRAGVKVPDELSIATFDDHALVERAIVPMTTVAVPMAEIGRSAAGLILGLLQRPNQRASKSIVLPEHLVVRQSTGPAQR